MNFNIYKLLLLTAGLAFASCSEKGNNDLAVKPGEGNSVYLKIDTRSLNQSRADVPTASNTSADLYTAMIYFLGGEADPVIYGVLTAGPGAQDITINDLEEGYLVEDVNSAVTQVYVIGNYNSIDQQGNGPIFPSNVGGLLSSVKSVLLDIQQISYPALTGVTITGDPLLTIMDGQAGLQTYGANMGGWHGTATPAVEDLYANVVISPMVARIEIEQIVYTGTYTFNLEGIYINNYFQKIPVSLSTSGYAAMNNGSVFAHYDVASPSFAYLYYTTLFDTLNQPVAPAGTVTPDNGVWAYQVFGNSSPVPHIILKLTDVVDDAGADLSDLYLTISGYQAGGNELSKFERNTVYKIASLSFSDENLNPVPEPETVDIWVHVEVEQWVTVNVTPIL